MKLRFLSSTVLLLGTAFTSHLFAGGATSSGGGNSFHNSDNPWFLENTEIVPYCIQIDEANFGVSLEFAKAKIEGALTYWKDNLRRVSFD